MARIVRTYTRGDCTSTGWYIRITPNTISGSSRIRWQGSTDASTITIRGAGCGLAVMDWGSADLDALFDGALEALAEAYEWQGGRWRGTMAPVPCLAGATARLTKPGFVVH